MKKYFLIVFLIIGVANLHAYSYSATNKSKRDVRVCVRVTGQHQCQTIIKGNREVFRWTGGDAGLTLVRITASEPNGANHTQRTYGNQTTEIGGLTSNRTFEIEDLPTPANANALFIREGF